MELLIMAALLSLLGTLFVWFLVPSMRISGRQSAQAEMQQQGTLAVNRVGAVLQTTAAAGISRRDNDPVSVAAVPIVDVDVQGRQQWAVNMTVFAWDHASGRLSERVWAQVGDAGRPVAVTPLQLLNFLNTGQGQPRSLAQGVGSFSVTGAAGDATMTMPLNVTLVLERRSSQREETERYAASRVVTVRQTR